MKIITRDKLDEKLAPIRVVKSPHYEATAEYDLQDGVVSYIDISDVEDADKERVSFSLIDSLFGVSDGLLIFPRYTYLCSEDDDIFFKEFGMAHLEDEAIEADKGDIDLIKKIVYYSFLKGGYVGWDLYITTSDGSILILVCHHDEFHIKSSSIEVGKRLSGLLNEKQVRHEHDYDEG